MCDPFISAPPSLSLWSGLILDAVIHEMFSPNANGVGVNGGQSWISSHAVGVAAKRECLAKYRVGVQRVPTPLWIRVMPEPIILSWSGGKDCALALSALRRQSRFEVVALASGFCRETNRIAIHEVRRELVREQAAALDIQLDEIDLPTKASNVEYEAAWSSYYSDCQSRGIGHVAFGDLFLADIRAYRERFVERLGLRCVFPLWKRATDELAREMIRDGWRAVVCCVDPSRLASRFVGRLYDESLLADLPTQIDPCGENGEFHTFVFDGPQFVRPVRWRCGEVSRTTAVESVELLPFEMGATVTKSLMWPRHDANATRHTHGYVADSVTVASECPVLVEGASR